MLNVALTGNIAAGKSTVTDWFRRWGATVIDADVLAREAQAPGTDVLTAIVRKFGADVLAADGGLDRAALRAKVMGDDGALTELNAIVHPAVRQRRAELQRAARDRGDALLVNDIPLLFEALDPAQFDAIVLVDAPDAVRRARLRALRGLPNEDADRMIAAQMSAERKRARSHHVINNAGTLAELEARARAVFLALRRAAARTGVEVLLLCAADAKDDAALLDAIATRYDEGGARVIRVSGKTALRPELGADAAAPGTVIVATAAAGAAARDAWADAGRPCLLLHLSRDPDPVAVRLDLRPWGHDRVALSEEDGAGLAPRPDLV